MENPHNTALPQRVRTTVRPPAQRRGRHVTYVGSCAPYGPTHSPPPAAHTTYHHHHATSPPHTHTHAHAPITLAAQQDGYAVVAGDGVGEYPVIGESRAGHMDDLPVTSGTVAYITTGGWAQLVGLVVRGPCGAVQQAGGGARCPSPACLPRRWEQLPAWHICPPDCPYGLAGPAPPSHIPR